MLRLLITVLALAAAAHHNGGSAHPDNAVANATPTAWIGF